MPTAIHIHGALHGGEQPKAKTRQMASSLDIPFQSRTLTKIKFGLATHKSISQTQAQEHASSQVKNHAGKSKPSSR